MTSSYWRRFLDQPESIISRLSYCQSADATSIIAHFYVDDQIEPVIRCKVHIPQYEHCKGWQRSNSLRGRFLEPVSSKLLSPFGHVHFWQQQSYAIQGNREPNLVPLVGSGFNHGMIGTRAVSRKLALYHKCRISIGVPNEIVIT